MPKIPPMQTLERDELERVLEVAKSESLRDYAFILLLALTGRRVSEAIAIKLKDIDFYHKTIRFPLLKRRKEMHQVVPVSAKLLEALQQYIEEYAIEDPEERVFPFSRQIARSICHKYGVLAGIKKKVYPHIFRHTFASRFLEKLNKPHEIYVLKEILGHAKIETTMRYLHVNLPKQREIVEKIANAIGIDKTYLEETPSDIDIDEPELEDVKEKVEIHAKKEAGVYSKERSAEKRLEKKVERFLKMIEEED